MPSMSSESAPAAVEPPALDTATTAFERYYATRGDYQRPDTPQTLREGLAEYYEVNPGLLDPSSMDDEFSASYFHCHDTTHVIFGTHTGPLDEGVNDVLTMFGVDVPYIRYIKGFFKTSGAGMVADQYKSLAIKPIFTSVVGTVRLMPRIWRTCRAMHKKWPWDPPEDALDRPLVDVRREYGIEVWRPEVVLGISQSE